MSSPDTPPSLPPSLSLHPSPALSLSVHLFLSRAKVPRLNIVWLWNREIAAGCCFLAKTLKSEGFFVFSLRNQLKTSLFFGILHLIMHPLSLLQQQQLFKGLNKLSSAFLRVSPVKLEQQYRLKIHKDLFYFYQLLKQPEASLAKHSQWGRRRRGTLPCTPWPAGSWADTSSAESPSPASSSRPPRPATAESCEPGRPGPAALTPAAEFALSYWSCSLRHTLYCPAEAAAAAAETCVHAAEESSPLCETSLGLEPQPAWWNALARAWPASKHFLCLAHLVGINPDCFPRLIGCCIPPLCWMQTEFVSKNVKQNVLFPLNKLWRACFLCPYCVFIKGLTT